MLEIVINIITERLASLDIAYHIHLNALEA